MSLLSTGNTCKTNQFRATLVQLSLAWSLCCRRSFWNGVATANPIARVGGGQTRSPFPADTGGFKHLYLWRQVSVADSHGTSAGGPGPV